TQKRRTVQPTRWIAGFLRDCLSWYPLPGLSHRIETQPLFSTSAGAVIGATGTTMVKITAWRNIGIQWTNIYTFTGTWPSPARNLSSVHHRYATHPGTRRLCP